jgi:hypothetical protein
MAPPFLTSVLNGGEQSASRSSSFTAGTHWIGGLVGPRADPDVVEKKFIDPTENQTQIPRPSRQ